MFIEKILSEKERDITNMNKLTTLPLLWMVIMGKKKQRKKFWVLTGVKTVKKIVKFASKLKIPILTFYVFSTENWRRPIK